MFRTLDIGPDGQITTHTGTDAVAPPPPGTRRWIDLLGQDDATLTLLRERFDFHPLAIEDCAHLDQRPKLEEYRDCLFIVTQSFACDEAEVQFLELQELHTFLGEQFLVTVHLGTIPALEAVWQRAIKDPETAKRGPDFLYYLIADSIVDDNVPILDKIADELETIEDIILTQPKRQNLGRIFALKRHLVVMRKILSPQRDVFAMLAKRGDRRISERTTLYFRDVYDHLARLAESIEANRDLLGNALDAYLSSVSNRTNEIMKYLTLMSAVFLPLTFIVGFFGQNFTDFPGATNWVENDGMMYAMVASCAVIPLGMFAWFRYKRWL